MGTAFNVKVVTEDMTEVHRERLTRGIREVVDGVDHAMSTYRPDSEIETFNRSGIEPFAASPEMLAVVAEAQRVARLTGGAFDITVGPLVEIWGFGPSGATETPSDEKLQELMGVTGYEQLELDVDGGTLRKAWADCRIDLSAIAKGFAVDLVTAALDREGYSDYMVEVGGEVRTRGRNGAGEAWRIGIERPDARERLVHNAIPLGDLSLATSGDYRNFVVRDGVRVSHTIDPRTGRPISHNLASVSVIHASCMPALFLIRAGDGAFEERHTGAWSALVENMAATEEVG